MTELSGEASGPVSIGMIRDALGDRSFAALLLFFAIINLIPLPPGTSALLGLPLLIVVGADGLWQQARLAAARPHAADDFGRNLPVVMDRVIPRLVWIERMIRPRYWPFWRRRGDRVIGIIALIMAITVTLPIPSATGCRHSRPRLLGLALSERDGILFALGSAVGLVAMALVASVMGAVIAATTALLNFLFEL